MSDPAEQPLEPSSAGPRPRSAAATQADPLAGDWSEGLRGPLRASGLPAPQPLAPRQAVPSLVVPTAVPAAPAAEASVSASPAPVPRAPLPAIEEWTVPTAQVASVDLSGWGTPAAAPTWAPAPQNGAYDPMEPAPAQAFAAGEAPFAQLAPGQELAPGDEDLLVPIDPSEETATAPIPPEAPPPGAGELWVPGEHRVAVHTREGGTRRGIVRNVDLSASSFPLLPHGGRSAVQVPAAEVKAIFFMLGPGEKLAPAGGARIRVMFLDGRTIEGTRDSGDAPKGFFLVPSDAARTSTRRVFVARDATKSVV